MPAATTYALFPVAALTALLHTLIPDHWLPFVLMGRAQRWSARTVALVSGLSALVHAALSLVLGLSATLLGLGAARMIGEHLERIAAVLLVLFGVAYTAWSWRKGGHFHPGGERVHRGAGGPVHAPEVERLHYHADGDLIEGRPDRGAVGLALIVGINPCVLALPVVLAAAGQGIVPAALVALSYGIPTIALTVGLSVLGARGRFRLPVPGVARFAERASGILIALLGLLYWLLPG